MVLSVPLGQVVQKGLDGVVKRHFLGVDIHGDVRLRIALLVQPFASGSDDDAVQSLLCQRTIVGSFIVGCLKLHLSIQHIASKQVVVCQELLDDKHIPCLGT